MSWRERPRLGAALLAPVTGALLLSACGFKPLYGRDDDGRSTVDELAAIRVVPLKDRPGQILHNNLRNQLNPLGQPRQPTYELRMTLRERKINTGVRKDETSTRSTLRLQAIFELTEVGEERPVFRGQTLSIVSFNIVDTEFSTYNGEVNARGRGLEQLAEDIRLRLAAYFTRVRQAQSGG